MSLAARIEAALGTEVTRLTSLHGGDLSDVRRADLEDGRSVVAKTGPLVDVEARMLCHLGAQAPAPRVLHSEAGLIVMEYLEEVPPSADMWAQLGQALRALHDHTGESYGWNEDYAFGSVTIPNTPCDDWIAFWANNRLLAAPDALPSDLRTRIEALCARLHDLLPQRPPASLLHGDLWSGNLLFSQSDGYLIDPACYYGHAEVDLAMLTLFGQPPTPFWEGYGTPDSAVLGRRVIYQIWPALVHLRLFGAGYHGMVCEKLTCCGA